MWKYVGQRLKDSAELTCSHIKNLRSTFSTCSTKSNPDCADNESHKDFAISHNGRAVNIWKCLEPETQKKGQSNPFDIDTPYIIQKCYQKQKQKQQDAFNGWIEPNLLQWTARFLASLYFGQMVCLYSRRRQNKKEWLHMEQLLTERSLRQLIESRPYYQKSYVPSNDETHWYDRNQMRQFQALMPVANDHSNLNQHDVTHTFASTATNKTDIGVAVDELIATLASIEFRLGMSNLRANEPETAVSHLKLATTHHHPEATYNLGICYEMGIGIEKSAKSAMECYRAAASLGHKKAMYNLGVFYVHGRGGLKKNRDAARACFEAADKMGLRQAKKALTIPETPVKMDTEVTWKSSDLIVNKISAAQYRHETSVN